MSAVLQFTEGNLAGQRVFCEGNAITVGRSASNTCVLSSEKASAVSSFHVQIEKRGDGWQITDLGSTNGTFLNGKRIDTTDNLPTGAVVQLGRSGAGFRFMPQIDPTVAELSPTLFESASQQGFAPGEFSAIRDNVIDDTSPTRTAFPADMSSSGEPQSGGFQASTGPSLMTDHIVASAVAESSRQQRPKLIAMSLALVVLAGLLGREHTSMRMGDEQVTQQVTDEWKVARKQLSIRLADQAELLHSIRSSYDWTLGSLDLGTNKLASAGTNEGTAADREMESLMRNIGPSTIVGRLAKLERRIATQELLVKQGAVLTPETENMPAESDVLADEVPIVKPLGISGKRAHTTELPNTD